MLWQAWLLLVGLVLGTHGNVEPAAGLAPTDNHEQPSTSKQLLDFPGPRLSFEPLADEPVVAPRLTIRHDIGDGVGYRDGFTYLEAFLPLWQFDSEAIAYFDARLVNFDDIRYWEFNAGGGLRWVNPFTERILGVNAFYDGRDGEFFFSQIGLGVESLGPILDLRANLYLPVGDSRRQSVNVFFNPHFVGHHIALDHLQIFDVAMGGFDLEAGGPVPILSSFDPRAYVGYYHYQAAGVPSADGVRVRLETQLSRNMSLHVAMQHDRVFETTFSAGLALHWGGSRSGPGRRTLAEALGQRVVRDVNIVTAQDIQQTKQLALDPASGQPIVVRHVNSNGPPDGDGTVERPFQCFCPLQTGSGPGDILFAHAGSVFNNQGIVLQDGQRFLGEGISHLFAAAQGTFPLPRATSGTALPVIADAPGRAIILASHTEVSGFTIERPARQAIFARDISDINVNRNIISDVPRSAIRLVDVSGNVYIADNLISNTDRHGIKIVSKNTTATTAAILGNVFTDIAVCGCGDPIHLEVRDSARWNGTISHNLIDGAGNVGIFVSARHDAAVRALVNHNTVLDVAFIGMYVEVRQAATGSFQVANNVFDQIGILGLFADASPKKSHLEMQIYANTSSVSFGLAAHKSGNFLLEDTEPTNNFSLGSAFLPTAGVTLVPFNSLGFPLP